MFQGQLEPQIDRIFTSLCIALPIEKIPQLREHVRQHVDQVRQALSHNEFLDVETVERMADVLTGLLDGYETYSESHRALIVGAARYFAKSDDAAPDTGSLLGFDDDVAVLNHVLDAVGAGKLKIEL